MEKAGIQRAQAYNRINAKAGEMYLPQHLAALAVAADLKIPLGRYATPDDLAQIRGSRTSSHASHPIGPAQESNSRKTVTTTKRKKAPKKPSNTVFVVHGRDHKVKDGVFAFLRSIGLFPIEWNQAIAMSKKGSPHVSEILDAAFAKAVASVVILTPDDEAQLRPQFRMKHDDAYEKKLTGQARPNVLFEAGMAFAHNERGTVLVQVGSMRPFSDVGGRHVVHLSNSVASRQQLAVKLQNAGCTVDLSGTDWHSVGNFAPTEGPKKKKKKE